MRLPSWWRKPRSGVELVARYVLAGTVVYVALTKIRPPAPSKEYE